MLKEEVLAEIDHRTWTDDHGEIEAEKNFFASFFRGKLCSAETRRIRFKCSGARSLLF